MPAAPLFGVHTPFDAQVEFLRAKLQIPTEAWDDLLGAAHDRAFVVAGAARAELLNDLHQALIARAADGRGLQAFRRDFEGIVKARGWSGWTGEGTPSGEAWRTRVMYATNMATSYAAGRYQQLTDPALLAVRPFWRWVHSDLAQTPRPQHVAWSGLTLRHDHPFWQTHYPPCGWGCHCYVVAVDAAAHAAAQAAGQAEAPEGWDVRDADTGLLPGIDRGWDYAPGRTWYPDLDALDPAIAGDVVRAYYDEGITPRWIARIHDGGALPAGEQCPIAVAPDAAAALGARGAVVSVAAQTVRSRGDLVALDAIAAAARLEEVTAAGDGTASAVVVGPDGARYAAALGRDAAGRLVLLGWWALA